MCEWEGKWITGSKQMWETWRLHSGFLVPHGWSVPVNHLLLLFLVSLSYCDEFLVLFLLSWLWGQPGNIRGFPKAVSFVLSVCGMISSVFKTGSDQRFSGQLLVVFCCESHWIVKFHQRSLKRLILAKMLNRSLLIMHS